MSAASKARGRCLEGSAVESVAERCHESARASKREGEGRGGRGFGTERRRDGGTGRERLCDSSTKIREIWKIRTMSRKNERETDKIY